MKDPKVHFRNVAKTEQDIEETIEETFKEYEDESSEKLDVESPDEWLLTRGRMYFTSYKEVKLNSSSTWNLDFIFTNGTRIHLYESTNMVEIHIPFKVHCSMIVACRIRNHKYEWQILRRENRDDPDQKLLNDEEYYDDEDWYDLIFGDDDN